MQAERANASNEGEVGQPAFTPVACAFLCRGGFEQALVAELVARAAPGADLAPLDVSAGLVVVPSLLAVERERILKAPLIFERQRMTDVLRLPPDGLKPLARAILRNLMHGVIGSGDPWTSHAFGAGLNEGGPASARGKRLEEVFLAMCHDRFPAVARRYIPAPEAAGRGSQVHVLQLCVIDAGVLGCVMRIGELADRHPGGIHRMHFDPLAPSRSYLKIEESFDLMGEEPRRGQRVVDIGAAPGGWTYAFLKRGCDVTAVDRAELKLRSFGETGGHVKHLREDGIIFVPAPSRLPVDWLVSDMLQPAGRNIGMLRKWMDNRWLRRFIFNVKLPQREPLAALQPVADYLGSVPGCRFTIRQLYHDREEVTVFGYLGR